MASRNGGGGTLWFRVEQVERNVGHIEKQVDAIREAMATRVDIEKITASVTALAQQASSAGKPNWQAMTVIVSALGLIGALVFWPLNTTITDMKAQIHDFSNTMVPLLRYNRDEVTRDAEAVIQRDELGKRITEREYTLSRDALKEHIEQLTKSRNSQVDVIEGRVNRLEGLHLKHE